MSVVQSGYVGNHGSLNFLNFVAHIKLDGIRDERLSLVSSVGFSKTSV